GGPGRRRCKRCGGPGRRRYRRCGRPRRSRVLGWRRCGLVGDGIRVRRWGGRGRPAGPNTPRRRPAAGRRGGARRSRIRPPAARRLVARVRERGAVLVVVGDDLPGERSHVRLTVTAAVWEGLETGAGHLQGRRVVVESGGRGEWARPR